MGAKKTSTSATPAKRARKTTASSSSSSSSKAAARSTYHHGDLFQALIEAARAELQDVGADALSLRGVARRAGVSHSAPYHHFADKEVLMAHLVREGFQTFATALRAGRDSVVPGADDDTFPGGLAGRRLGAIGAAYLRFARAEPAYFAVITGGCGGHAEIWQEAGDAAFAVLQEAVAAVRGVAGQDADPGAAHDDALLHWGVVHGLAKLEAENGIGATVDVDALWRRLAHRLMGLYR